MAAAITGSLLLYALACAVGNAAAEGPATAGWVRRLRRRRHGCSGAGGSNGGPNLTEALEVVVAAWQASVVETSEARVTAAAAAAVALEAPASASMSGMLHGDRYCMRRHVRHGVLRLSLHGWKVPMKQLLPWPGHMVVLLLVREHWQRDVAVGIVLERGPGMWSLHAHIRVHQGRPLPSLIVPTESDTIALAPAVHRVGEGRCTRPALTLLAVAWTPCLNM